MNQIENINHTKYWKVVEKLELSYTAGGNIKGYGHIEKQFGRPQITNVAKDVEKREPLCTVGGNVNCL